jgi:hypothetical protein
MIGVRSYKKEGRARKWDVGGGLALWYSVKVYYLEKLGKTGSGGGAMVSKELD